VSVDLSPVVAYDFLLPVIGVYLSREQNHANQLQREPKESNVLNLNNQ
jgi:hypothetical protein